MEYKFYEHNASDIMQELIQQGEFHITASGHTVSTKVNIVPYAVIIIDPQRIQQVISNLISNAIRHTPSGRKISISCVSYPYEEMMHAPSSDDDYSIPDGEILVTVSDQGDGIPEKDIPHIFERNFGYRRALPTKATPVWGFIFPARSSPSIPGGCLQRIIQTAERRYRFPCRIIGKIKVCSGHQFFTRLSRLFLFCYSLHLRASSIGTLRIFLLSARLMMAYITIPMRNISGNSDGFT